MSERHETTEAQVAEILDTLYSHPSVFDALRLRVVIGIWDEGDEDGYTVYAVIEDQASPSVALYGEASYGSYTVGEALEALLKEIQEAAA